MILQQQAATKIVACCWSPVKNHKHKCSTTGRQFFVMCLQHKAAKRLPESTDSRAAQLLLDKLCALYHDKKARYTDSQRYEKLRYDMLIAAIDGALPEHSSAMVSA